MLIADSHEFIELYRGARDLQIGMEMVRLRDDLRFVSFAPEILSPSDSALTGARSLSEVELPALPERMELRLLPARTVRFARREAGGKLSLMRGYGRALAEVRPDAIIESVYTWLTPRSYTTMRVAQRLRVPVIYYDPGDDVPVSGLQRLALGFERPVLRKAARIITFNGIGRRRFMSKYGYPEERIRVIPKPVEVALWHPRVDVAEVRGRLGIPAGAFVIAYVGRLAELKGSRALADVARIASTEPSMAHWRMLFVGSALDSAEDEADYRLPNTVVTGMLPNEEVPAVLAAADVVVFPDVAHRGGFWTSIAEAMAAGKPIVLGAEADQESVPLRDGETALFARPGDSASLLDAFRRLEADAGLRERLGGAVWRYASENMDFARVAEAWLAVVEEAIASGRATPSSVVPTGRR